MVENNNVQAIVPCFFILCKRQKSREAHIDSQVLALSMSRSTNPVVLRDSREGQRNKPQKAFRGTPGLEPSLWPEGMQRGGVLLDEQGVLHVPVEFVFCCQCILASTQLLEIVTPRSYNLPSVLLERRSKSLLTNNQLV